MSKQTYRFRVLKQGYDRFEVDKVLVQYEDELSQLKNKLTSYQNQITALKEQIKHSQEKYDELIRSLKIREKAADEINRLALKEANKVIETATNNADIILSQALSQARSILMEVSDLAEKTQGTKDEMMHQVNRLYHEIDNFKIPQVPSLQWLKELNIKGKE